MNHLPRAFPYFGSKHRSAKRYPAPEHDVIIEPFAGSAGYSLYHFQKQVHLFDLDEIVCGVWDYLINADPTEILKLPLKVVDVRALDIPEEARWLIGYWMHTSGVKPIQTSCKFHLKGAASSTGERNKGSYWDVYVRTRLANLSANIKHWKIHQASYNYARNKEATWFIDPPYQGDLGNFYVHDNEGFDYSKLAAYCKSRHGQVIVCEAAGANWLPFYSIGTTINATDEIVNGIKVKRKTEEMVWLNK